MTTKNNMLNQKPRTMEKTTDISKWGKDHWSLLAYCETRTVDYAGKLDLRHMRVNSEKRSFSNGSPSGWEPSWGTTLKDMVIEDGSHDDIDVLDDLEAEGFLLNLGTDINPLVKLTDRGRKIAAQLRAHKADGGYFATFEPNNKKP